MYVSRYFTISTWLLQCYTGSLLSPTREPRPGRLFENQNCYPGQSPLTPSFLIQIHCVRSFHNKPPSVVVALNFCYSKSPSSMNETVYVLILMPYVVVGLVGQTNKYDCPQGILTIKKGGFWCMRKSTVCLKMKELRGVNSNMFSTNPNRVKWKFKILIK